MLLTTELQIFLANSFFGDDAIGDTFYLEKMDSNRYGDVTFIVKFEDKFYAVEAYYDSYHNKLDFSTLIREVKPIKKVVYEYSQQVDLDDLDSESYEDSQ